MTYPRLQKPAAAAVNFVFAVPVPAAALRLSVASKDSLRDFLTSAFDDSGDCESPSWCKAELGEEALSIFKNFSFRAKKTFDAFCADMKMNKVGMGKRKC